MVNKSYPFNNFCFFNILFTTLSLLLNLGYDSYRNTQEQLVAIVTEKKKQLMGDVLIADVDIAYCEVVKQYCINMGIFRNILLVHDGSMASSKMRNQKFALIIVDLKLPKKNGLELVREMDDKSLNQKSSVIVASGSLDKTMLDKLVSLGIRLILPKPFGEASFQEKVLKIFGAK